MRNVTAPSLGVAAKYLCTKPNSISFVTSLADAITDIKDLDKVNEELNLEEEIIEIRSLELQADEQMDTSGIEDEDLEKVTEHVNAIQDNIRNLFAADVEDEDEDEELEEDDAEVDSHVKTDVETDVETDVKTDVKDEASTNIHALVGAVPQDILNAAFAEEDEDPPEPGEDVVDSEEDK